MLLYQQKIAARALKDAMPTDVTDHASTALDEFYHHFSFPAFAGRLHVIISQLNIS